MYTYDDYDYDVINESALDMAMDMSDRYGVAIEDAYEFACDALEGSLKDPHKRDLRERYRAKIAAQAHTNILEDKRSKDKSENKWVIDKCEYDKKRNARLDRKGLDHLNSLSPVEKAMFGRREADRYNDSVRRRRGEADDNFYRRLDNTIDRSHRRQCEADKARDDWWHATLRRNYVNNPQFARSLSELSKKK